MDKETQDYEKMIQVKKWCWKNNIRVYVQPTRQGRKPPVKIVLEYKGHIQVGKKTFKQGTDKLNETLDKVYLWAYNRAIQAE